MIKILHLISTFKIKTDTKWLMRLLPAIDKDKYQLIVGAFYDDGPVREKFERLDIETFLLGYPRTYDMRVLYPLIKKIRQLQPNIIHTHLLRADLFGGLAGRITHTPVVSTIYAQGKYFRANKRLLDPLIDKITYQLPNHFIAVCKSIREDLITRLHIPPEKITVIHTGIDIPRTDARQLDDIRRKYAISEGEKIILVPARLSYEKGIESFLYVVKILTERGTSARFMIAGDGPMKNELQALADELGIADRVEFLGFVEQIEALIKLAYAVVIPSYSEGLPNVALETFSAGTPLIASSVGGLIDLTEYNSEAVILVKPNDPPDLADKILQALNNPEQMRSMVSAARAIIDEFLSTEKVARKYESLYQTICRFTTP